LLEHFTNSSDESCDSVNILVNDLSNQNEMNIIDLQYHTSFPGPDPFNLQNPAVPGARVFYYGLSDVPYTLLNGGSKPLHRFDHKIIKFNPTSVLVESLEDSKFSINLKSTLAGNILTVQAQVFSLQDFPATQLTVHIAVLEQIIASETGSNGESIFENVVKAMLPDAAGTSIHQEWEKDEPRTVEATWELEHVYDTSQIRVVAFIQDETTGEIYQAALGVIDEIIDTGQDDLPGLRSGKSFVVYPNPAEREIYIEFYLPTTETLTLQLYNNLGNLVLVKQIPVGTQKSELRVDEYPDGLYILRFIGLNQLRGTEKLNIFR
jgi:hypothetical protein